MIWTDEQVENLKKRQNNRSLHPYTCAHGHGELIPTNEGWVCSECDYTQDWAFGDDLSGRTLEMFEGDIFAQIIK